MDRQDGETVSYSDPRAKVRKISKSGIVTCVILVVAFPSAINVFDTLHLSHDSIIGF